MLAFNPAAQIKLASCWVIVTLLFGWSNPLIWLVKAVLSFKVTQKISQSNLAARLRPEIHSLIN